MTNYHASYYSHELTKRSSSDNIAKLGASLANATVDLNPHQLDAALFAFRSPISRGAILADEVGLGKTIEAGLVISQLWAERKRRILVIAPTILRKQWAQELSDKFFIPSLIVDSKEYNSILKAGGSSLSPTDEVVIVSYHFARARATEIHAAGWDLVIIDEAHRLRNVYKPGNKIASAIKRAVRGYPLLLLTATPLQNSLLELYGLVSFLDEHLFGDIEAFRARYMRGPIEQRQLDELKHRLRPVCQRTLRRQVTEYVRFTNRIPMTQDFTPTDDEQELYDKVTAYLQRESLNALPASQRKLLTLVLRKLLASSSFAIAGTFASLVDRLKSRQPGIADEIGLEFDALSELKEEWDENSESSESDTDASNRESVAEEIEELTEYGALASSITVNAKGQALLIALDQGFKKLGEIGAARKAIIFTESRRTQTYLMELLTSSGYADRILTINGTNTDDRAGAVYKAWRERHSGEAVVTGNKTVDLRAALVEHFQFHADILIATEAASEGVNLQFCSLVVNYDLPWNPQRIEQRIGRCHRYGQKHDVVVINFLNRTNEADQRVFELLSEKFRLFDGVFGSSDEVLGALESGVDFERRIAEIYQTCRTAPEIDLAFDQLRLELEEPIAARMADTRTALIENFDQEVHQRLRLSYDQSKLFLDKMERTLWNLTKHELRDIAEFDDASCEFDLLRPATGLPEVPLGRYQCITRSRKESRNFPYRLGHPLAEQAVRHAQARELPCVHLHFDYATLEGKIGLVEELRGKTGWLSLSRLTVDALDREDHLLFSGFEEGGKPLHSEVCEKLFHLHGQVLESLTPRPETVAVLERTRNELELELLGVIAARNSRFFDEEIEKLERWADDLKHSLEMELKDLDSQIKQADREAKLATNLENKLAFHRAKKELEAERGKKRRELYEAQDEIETRKDLLISKVEARLKQEISNQTIFTIRWSVA